MVYQPDGTCPSLPLVESPYYKTLVTGERKWFDRYKQEVLAEHSPETFKQERSYARFINLGEKIIHQGFDPAPPRITFDEDGVTALDGQHRLAILLHTYGPELLLQVEDNQVMGIIKPEV